MKKGKKEVTKKESKTLKEKNILMLNYEFPPLGGGAGNATYYLLKEFSKPQYKDLKIDLVTSSTSEFKINLLLLSRDYK